MKAYSHDEESWTQDIDAAMEDAVCGGQEFIYEADSNRITSAIFKNEADWLLDHLSERFHDITGISEQSPFDDISPKSSLNLNKCIQEWIDEHTNINEYFLVDVKTIKKIPVEVSE